MCVAFMQFFLNSFELPLIESVDVETEYRGLTVYSYTYIFVVSEVIF
jgi:hypothetical protein